MAGLSMAELSAKSGMVTKQAISKYEKGLMKPDSQVIIAFAKALNIKIDYFFRVSEIKVSNIEYRKRSKLTQKNQNIINQKIVFLLEKHFEIEQLLNIKNKFENPLNTNNVACLENLEDITQELRQLWALGEIPINHLTEVLVNKGIKIFEMDVDKKFDGLSTFVSGVPIIAFQSNMDLVRKRFTIAHELGHILLCFSDDISEKQKEKLCNSFAGALLLPKNVIFQEIGNKRTKIAMWELKRLKGIYGLSIQAIMARAFHLGIISENTYKYFKMFFNKNGWKKNEPGDYNGIEKNNHFEKLVFYALLENIITLSKASELLDISISDLKSKIEK